MALRKVSDIPCVYTLCLMGLCMEDSVGKQIVKSALFGQKSSWQTSPGIVLKSVYFKWTHPILFGILQSPSSLLQFHHLRIIIGWTFPHLTYAPWPLFRLTGHLWPLDLVSVPIPACTWFILCTPPTLHFPAAEQQTKFFYEPATDCFTKASVNSSWHKSK